MIEHPVVLSQSYFDVVLKNRNISKDDLLARTEYQLVKVNTTSAQPSDPFLNVTEILSHEVEPLHTVTLKNLSVNTTHYFRARFVTMKGYTSPWTEPYVIKVGDHLLKRPIILDPISGIDQIGASLKLKLSDIQNHPYFYKFKQVDVQIYKIIPDGLGCKYLSTIIIESTEPAIDKNTKIFNKGSIASNILNIVDKFASNSNYLIRLNYSYQESQSPGVMHTSDYTEDFSFKTKPYYIELAKILVEPVTDSVTTNNNTITTSVPPVAEGETPSSPTTVTSVTTKSLFTIRNSIIDGCIQIAPPRFIEPIDRVKVKVQVSGDPNFGSLVLDVNQVYKTSDLATADLNYVVSLPASGVRIVYYARASWTEYIEYTDSLGVYIIESPVNWGEVKIIEIIGK